VSPPATPTVWSECIAASDVPEVGDLSLPISPTRQSTFSSNATPDMKRRTRSLALRDKQWDALFEGQQPQRSPTTPSRPTLINIEPRRYRSESAVTKEPVRSEKALATPAQRHPGAKRKRPADIFRTKPRTPSRSGSVGANATNSFSRFLSRNPALASTLCFASPVHSNAEPEVVPLDEVTSVVSDSHTLHTQDDTIASTVYYEEVKLAGMQQHSPLMPLFPETSIRDGDIIRLSDPDERRRTRTSPVVPSAHVLAWKEPTLADSRQPHGGPDASLPPMTKSSSDSTRQSDA
jgi:hypothetical protein